MMAWPAPDPCPMDVLHHPAFQSLLLPALLSFVCLAALHLGPVAALRACSALGAALGLVLAFAVWPGFQWPTSTMAQRVPWAALAALVAVALAQALALARAARAPSANARGWAVALAVALFGLAGLAVLAASLLLAQLALMVASATAVLALWAWLRPRSGLRVTVASLLPLASAGLVLAYLVAALAWTAFTPPGADTAAPTDDPYYTPRR
jgi:hypothetical protein